MGRREARRQLAEDTRDLAGQARLLGNEVVVAVDDVLRLDVNGLSRLRDFVDDAAHATPKVRPDGDDLPAVAQRRKRRLQGGLKAVIGKIGPDEPLDVLPDFPDALPDGAKLG